MKQQGLTQEEASEYLSKNFDIDLKPSTLRTYRRTGAGPRFFRVKKTPLYTPETLDEFATGRTQTFYANTAEEKAVRA